MIKSQSQGDLLISWVVLYFYEEHAVPVLKNKLKRLWFQVHKDGTHNLALVLGTPDQNWG
jgi:hypothetical protein